VSKQLDSLFRKHLLELKPYASARDDFSGTAQIYLDANENARGSAISLEVNRYPDPYQRRIRNRLAEIHQLDSNRIFLGHGSDEAIDLLIRLTCDPAKHQVVVCPPTYGMYAVSAAIHNVEVVEIPLTGDFQLNTAELVTYLNSHAAVRLLFICSPNNPTGNLMKEEDVKQILDSWTGGLVVVDEAYIDFSGSNSWITRLPDYSHLVVLQTFSKAWGMAALRVGMAYGHPDVIHMLDRIKPPYNVNGLTQDWVEQALVNTSRKDELVKELNESKASLREMLEQLELVEHIHPSDANFFLVKVTDAHAIYHYLMHQAIIVRNRSSVQKCENCLRITVGTPEENERLIEALKVYKA